MSLVHINWRPDAKELRKFGITVLIGFAIIGLVVFFTAKTPASACWLWGIGAVFGLSGLTGTVIALPFYFIWMGIAFVIGNIMSRVIMFLIYFGVVTPLGFIMRLTGRDRLRLKKSKGASYWVDAPSHDKDSYQRQF
jgi:Saxitoxin biosynthesis operon protein SxtJ